MRRRFAAYASILFLALGAWVRTRHNGAGEDLGRKGGPLIDVWYGSEQWFGQLGNPQQWANILGNVSSPIGVASLRYSLNGGKWKGLRIGPDRRRLASAGDFNAEIDIDDLVDGQNVVKIEAVDMSGGRSVSVVSVHYARGRTWPMPYTIHWSAAPSVPEVAQVVDGRWKVGDGLRPAQLWYDRMVAIGDVSWTDYEVTVPVTIRRFDPAAYNPISFGPMVGIALRWKGHYDYALDGSQPRSVAWPLGVLCMYGWVEHLHKAEFRLELQRGRTIAADDNRTLSLGVRYIFKARAETRPHQTSFYRFKVWQDGTPEPSGWDLSGPGAAQGNDRGSVLLVAHHSDVTFGDVTVVPVAVNSGHGERASSLLARPNPSEWKSR